MQGAGERGGSVASGGKGSLEVHCTTAPSCRWVWAAAPRRTTRKRGPYARCRNAAVSAQPALRDKVSSGGPAGSSFAPTRRTLSSLSATMMTRGAA